MALGSNRGRGVAVDKIVSDRLGMLMVCVRRCVCAALVIVCGIGVDLHAGNDWYGDDADVRRYGLRNGLEVIVVPRGDAEINRGRDSVQLWLSVKGGMLDEADDERGASHLVGELLRGGVGGFDREQVRLMLLSEDERASQARAVQVELGRTLFMGQAPSGDAEAVASLLGYYASVLEPSAWSMDTDSFEEDRAWLRGRVEGALEPLMIARQRWLGRLFGEGTLGARLPLPELDEIDALTVDHVRSYSERVYRPGRAVLMVTGDPGAVDLDAIIAKTLGSLENRGRGRFADTSNGLDGDRVIFGQEPGWSQHQAVLIWADVAGQHAQRRDVSLGFTHDEIYEYVVQRVAEEVIRRRIEQLGIARFGNDGYISVDSYELGPRLEVLQFLIQREDGADGDEAWSDSIELLIAEAMRLVQHGGVRDEIVQARGALLAQWHRNVESGRTGPSRDYASSVSWLVNTGRPIMSAARWDEIATGMMSSISDDAVNTEIARLIDPARMQVLVSRGGDRAKAAEKEILLEVLVADVMAEPSVALDDQWMRTLGGDLIDEREMRGRIDRVTQHAPSGTWGGMLGNGVRLWVREVNQPGVVEVHVMLSGEMFQDGTLSEGEIDAAMLAWRHPSTEDRELGWVAVFMETHGLKLSADRVVGGVRLRVRSSSEDIDAALELMYAMLSRPMVDAERFERWAKGEQTKYGGGDPLDRGLAMLFRPELLRGDEKNVERDDAQRALARITLGSQIEVAIAGDVDAPDVLERGSAMFGTLRDRVENVLDQTQAESELRLTQQSVQLAAREPMMLTGVVGGQIDDLERLRTGVIASMVVSRSVKDVLEQAGIDRAGVAAQIITSDALGGRWVFVLRVQGKAFEEGEVVFRQAIEQIAAEGIDQETLERVLQDLDSELIRGMGQSRYWAARMSMMGAQGRTLDELWEIREGYASVRADEVNGFIQELMDRSGWFRIDVGLEDEAE